MNNIDTESEKRIINTLGTDDSPDKYYVYALATPDNNIFYIGKGTGARLWQHEKVAEMIKETNGGEEAQKVTEKIKEIQNIWKNNEEPKKIIIKYGLTEAEAFAAESALINLLNYPDKKLTNIANGHASDREKTSRIKNSKAMTVDTFLKDCSVERKEVTEDVPPFMFFKIDKSYPQFLKEVERIDGEDDRTFEERLCYECVRGFWKNSLTRAKRYRYVLALKNGIVCAAFHVKEWYLAGEYPEKLSKARKEDTRKINSPQNDQEKKWCKERIGFVKSNEPLNEKIKNLVGKYIFYENDPDFFKSQNSRFSKNLQKP